jgi:hypothetical protein
VAELGPAMSKYAKRGRAGVRGWQLAHPSAGTIGMLSPLTLALAVYGGPVWDCRETTIR